MFKIYCKFHTYKFKDFNFPYRFHDPLSAPQEIRHFQAYLVYLKDVENVAEVFNYFWNVSYVTNVNVIVPWKQYFRRFSYSPFSSTGCREIFIEEHTSSRETNVYFPQKPLNLYKCPIRTISWNWLPYSKVDGNNVTFFEGSILNEFIRSVNASFSASLIDLGYGLMSSKVYEKKADLMNGEYLFNPSRCANFSAGDSHYKTSVIMFLKKESFLKSSTIILLSPFSKWVWFHLIVMTMAISAFGSYLGKISFLKCFFVTISILFANSYKMRKTQFQLRLCFGIWIIISLIMSAMYHAVFFEILRSDLHYPLPNSFAEILARNFSKTFILDFYTKKDIFYVPEILSENFSFIVTEKNEPPLEEALATEEKVIGVSTIVLFNYHSMRLFGSTETFRRLPEEYLSLYYTIYFSKNSFLINDYNQMLRKLQSGGITHKWIEDLVQMKRNKTRKQKRSMVLSYDEVGAIFRISAILFLFSSLVFMWEIRCLLKRKIQLLFAYVLRRIWQLFTMNT